MKFPEKHLPTKLSTRIGAVVLALVVIVGLTVVGVRQFTGLPGNAALKYDGSVVTKAELNDRADLLGALYGIQAPKGKKALDTFHRDIAKAVAVSMILDKAAAKRHIVISDKSARDTLSGMIKDQLGADPEAAFTKILGEFGVNEDEVLGEIKRQQSIARLFQSVTKDTVATATPSAVRSFFDKDPAAFAVPEERRLSNIVVATSAEASSVVANARKGKDFGTLARTTSLDDATRDKGGDLGTVSGDKLDPAFAKAAFAAPPGGVFGPVKTQYGWNVGTVVKVIPGKAATFATVKDQVTDALRSKKALAFWRSWLARQIKDADVDYAAHYLPAHPDDPPADSGVSQSASTADGAGTAGGQ